MGTNMTKECRQQFTLRITQANKTELIVILYEMILTYLDDAERALRQVKLRILGIPCAKSGDVSGN